MTSCEQNSGAFLEQPEDRAAFELYVDSLAPQDRDTIATQALAKARQMREVSEITPDTIKVTEITGFKDNEQTTNP